MQEKHIAGVNHMQQVHVLYSVQTHTCVQGRGLCINSINSVQSRVQTVKRSRKIEPCNLLECFEEQADL